MTRQYAGRRHGTRVWVAVAIGAALLVAGLGVTGAVTGLSDATDVPAASTATPSAAPQGSGQGGTADDARAEAEAQAALSYVALGDSFAAGLSGADSPGACQRGAESYPQVLGAVPGIDLTADATCSGAVTGDMGGQLTGLSAATTLVTLTVGGNDLDFASVVDTCLQASGGSCQADIDAAADLLTSGALGDRLAAVYAQIAAAAPNARTVVTGYPYLYAPSTDPLITQLNAATAALNLTIRGAVAAAQAQRPEVGIDFVDVTSTFAGHGINDADPWISDTGTGAFHPTVAGYGAYAAAVRSAL